MSVEIPLQDRIKASDEGLSSLFPMEAQIVASVHNAAVDSIGKRAGEWTASIKNALADLANEKGVLQCPNQLSGQWQFSTEWMLDVIWIAAKRNDDGTFDWRDNRGLVLACESEWLTGEYHVLEDFLKLTFVQAELRLFIYTNKPVESGQHPVDVCRQASRLSGGFRYLTMGFPESITAETKTEFSTRVDAWTT